MVNSESRPKFVVQLQVDSATALARFRSKMGRGILRPGGIEAQGVWSDAELLYVPVRRSCITMSTNWSAESGSLGPNKKLTWAPTTGTHRGIHNGILVATANGPWLPAAMAVAAKLDSLDLVDPSNVGDVRALAPTSQEAQIEQATLAQANAREHAACLAMVPGQHKRGLKLNSTTEGQTSDEILIPVYAFRVQHKGSTYSGHVDGIFGGVYARPPTSMARIFAIGGVATALFFMFLVFTALLGSMSAKRAAQDAELERAEQARAETARVESVKAEMAASQARLSSGLDQIEAALASRDLEQARKILDNIAPELERFHAEGMSDDIAAIWSRYTLRKPEVEHAEAVHKGIAAAKAVVGDKQSCNTPVDISTAWTDLKVATVADPEWKEALSLTSRLERCRLTCEQDLSKGLKELMQKQREELAATMERKYLDNGFDVRVSIVGRQKNQLRITWVLLSRATVHQITDGGSMNTGSLLRNLQDAGFEKVVFGDGYTESWTYTLEPTDEEHGGTLALADLGLGEPLKLSK